MELDPKEAAFLAELKPLMIKHEVFIGGCGCCDSPYLVLMEDSPYKTVAEAAEESVDDLNGGW
jgi:hypothetical protein